MTHWLLIAAFATAACVAGEPDVVIPVRLIIDSPLTDSPLLESVWKPVWTETVDVLKRAGIHLQSGTGPGRVRRTPSGSPFFTGLIRGVVNVVVTARMPVNWDLGRGVTAVTTSYEGHHLVLIALDRAHGNQIPFLSVNTFLHELLHVLLQDVYEKRPSGLEGETREFRVDAYATTLWLFGDGGELQDAARRYLARLRSADLPR